MKPIHRPVWPLGIAAFVAAVTCHAALEGQRAQAQCSDACNKLAHHWDFKGLAGTNSDETLVIGMWSPDATHNYPMVCRFNPFIGLEFVTVDDRFIYSSRSIPTDVSFCGNGGKDRIIVMTDYDIAGVTCQSALGPLPMLGFNTTATLSISGGAGDDDIRVIDHNDATAITMCGGDGSDVLIGGWQGQYIDAGIGNDYLGGGTFYDNVRGRNGNDVIVHNLSPYTLVTPTAAGEDYMRGDSGDDCFDLRDGVRYDSRTDGGNDRDTYEMASIPQGLPLPGTEDVNRTGDNCCAEPGKFCPSDAPWQ